MTIYATLGLAIAFEVLGTTLLQRSEQFSRLWPALGTLACYLVSFYLLSLSLRVLPLGIAYAIWSAVGIVLVALIGWIVFGQRIDLAGILGLGLIIAGVLVVNLFSRSIGH